VNWLTEWWAGLSPQKRLGCGGWLVVVWVGLGIAQFVGLMEDKSPEGFFDWVGLVVSAILVPPILMLFFGVLGLGFVYLVRLANKKTQPSTAAMTPLYERLPIPERVRNEVWRRDQGECARCGSRERLEYDHIIPVSKGGSNTARNIELLCQSCNGAKGARIG
jgi:hypothetical protein